MSYGAEVATAFVRIRPNLEGFKSQTAAGVRSALEGIKAEVASVARANVAQAAKEVEANRLLAESYLSIGKAAKTGSVEAQVAAEKSAEATRAANVMIGRSADHASERVGILREHMIGLGEALGIAFGTVEAIRFTKEITSTAAGVQKSIEVIKNAFGPDASEVITKFGDIAAAKLGISAEAANATSAKFGILFKQMGLAPQLAATMTINLEKLAGSLSAIRGVDPTRALQSISLAMLGNVRSLKQLGVAVDPATIKLAALKMRLIETKDQALTPAIRAQAIYAIATAHLGEFQALAAGHANDYANVQRRLSAEWSNAKDVIGTALLPVFTKYSLKLAEWLQQSVESGSLQKDVNTILRDAGKAFDTARSSIQSIAGPIEKFVGYVGGAKNALKLFLALMVGFKVASFVGGLKLASGAIIGVGGAAEGAAGEVVGLRGALLGLTRLAPIAIPIVIAYELKKKGGIFSYSGLDLFHDIRKILHGVSNQAIDDTKSGPAQLGIADVAGPISKGLLSPAGVKALRDRFVNPQQFKDAMALAVQDWKQVVKDGMVGIQSGAAGAVKTIQAPLAAEGAVIPKSVIAGIMQGLAPMKEALAQMRLNLTDAIKKQVTDVHDAVESAKQNLDSIGQSLASSIAAVTDQPYVVAGQKIQNAQDRLALIFDRKSVALDAQARKISALQAGLGLQSDKLALQNLRAEIMLPGGRALSNDPARALKQLGNLEKGANVMNKPALDAFILQYRGALLTVQSDKVGIRQQALSNRRTVAETGLNLRGEALRVSQDQAEALKRIASRSIADLTAAFNRGAIKFPEFARRVASLLEKEHVSFAKAGKLLGSAFEVSFRAQVRGLLKQAHAVSVGPQVAGTSGADPKIINPLQVQARDTAAILRITRDIGHKQLAIQTKMHKDMARAAKAAEKTAVLQAAINGVVLGDTAKAITKNPGHQSKTTQHLSSRTG